MNGHAPLTEPSLGEGKGKEGKGRERASAREPPPTPNPTDPEPPSKCEQHKHLRNPPKCGHCADARKRHDAWQTDRNERQRLAAKCRLHRGELAHNCRICAAEELNPA